MCPSRMGFLLLVLVTSSATAQQRQDSLAPTVRKAIPCGPKRKCMGPARPTLSIEVPDSAGVGATIVPVLRIINHGGKATRPMSVPVTFNNHFADDDGARARRTVAIPAIAPGDTLDVPAPLVTDATPWYAEFRGKGRVRVNFLGTGVDSKPIYCRIPTSPQP